MKKYLMTGVAALALCAGFTACSSDEDLYDESQITQNRAALEAAQYEQGFVNAFGQPSKTHTWGFGNAVTRADINVNGNLWESCPAVGSTEDADVAAYVRSLTTLPNTNPAQLQNYYVTQIHKGTETYTDLDNHSGILGSDKMNNLHIAMQSSATLDKSSGKLSGDWEHINNFNAGNCTDWSAGVDGHGNTLVTGGGTFDFAYLGAEDSKYHNRWIAIDGANVPKTGGGNYAGNYYVCFDFEATNDYVQTVFQVSQPGNNPGETFTDNVTVNGAWTVESAAAAGLKVTARGNEVTITTSNATVTQYVQGNMVVIGNDIYDDWIIRLVEAEPINTPTTKRVIAEDLSASEKGDFDFNDVVFDAELDNDGNVTAITVLYCGAEYAMYVDGHEVHDGLGLGMNPSRPDYYQMGRGNGAYNITPTSGKKLIDIEVKVKKFYYNENKEKVYYEVILDAPLGRAPGKICVNSDFEWCPERVDVANKYPKFIDWVSDETKAAIWWKE